MNFAAEVRDNVIPEDSGSFIESIKVADISPDDVAALHRIITNVPVANDIQGWSYQDYIMERRRLHRGYHGRIRSSERRTDRR